MRGRPRRKALRAPSEVSSGQDAAPLASLREKLECYDVLFCHANDVTVSFSDVEEGTLTGSVDSLDDADGFAERMCGISRHAIEKRNPLAEEINCAIPTHFLAVRGISTRSQLRWDVAGGRASTAGTSLGVAPPPIRHRCHAAR